MSKAYEVMTQTLATCSPDDQVAQIAAIMRDRDIGNVLVVEDGKLRGIVTDRDLALNMLSGNGDYSHTPVKNIMSSKVITGNPDWNIGRVARTMAKHQVRRLPIIDNDQLVGIITLGDIAKHTNRPAIVARSLKAISNTPAELKPARDSRNSAIVGLSLLALTSTMAALLTWNRSGREIRRQVADTKFFHTAQEAVNTARGKVDEAASSKTARNLRHQINTNLKELSYQLPRIEYKPPKRKPVWFR